MPTLLRWLHPPLNMAEGLVDDSDAEVSAEVERRIMADSFQTFWAVIQTGTITPDADIVPFRTMAGKRTPAILFAHVDHAKVERMRKRLASRFAKFRGLGGGAPDDMQLCTPILGVIPILCDLAKKRKPVLVAPSANGEPPAEPGETGNTGRRRGRPKSTAAPVPAEEHA